LEPAECRHMLEQSRAQLVGIVCGRKSELDLHRCATALRLYAAYRPSLAQRLPEPGINVGFDALLECRISVIAHRVRSSRPVGLKRVANCIGTRQWRVKALWHNVPPAASPGIA